MRMMIASANASTLIRFEKLYCGFIQYDAMKDPVPVSAEPIAIPMAEVNLPAGFPSPCADHEVKQIDLNEVLLLNTQATFMFRVRGESMIGAGIHDGDTLIVDRSIRPAHNHVVVAVIDGEFTVKRLYHRMNKVMLLPENPDFSPIEFKDGQELRVFGVATHNIHHLAPGPWNRE